ncbi:MAG TPA: HAD family hydrolase [Actinomycetota bacterium]|jgi:putative hydrolase of the HAD superfamily
MIEVVFFDVGGPIYGDRPYYEALRSAIREAVPDLDEAAYWAEFEECRRDQDGSFTRRLVTTFVPHDRVAAVIRRGRDLWEYPPDAVQPDARSALQAMHGAYRLGILANQERWIRDTLRRDGLDGFFEVWAVSAEVGAEKPDPRLFDHAVRQAGVPAERCAMIGDRLDNDIVPARSRGMHAVWLLRGEAPDDPSAEQLAKTDAAVRSLDQVPDTIARM